MFHFSRFLAELDCWKHVTLQHLASVCTQHWTRWLC